MFSNFKDAFIRKPQFTSKLPQAVLETVSRSLPEGFRYVEDHDGFCRLDCDGALEITPSSVRLPAEAAPLFEALGKITMNEVSAYAYNSQTQIELVPDKNGFFVVNGKRIKMDDFVVAPLKNTQLREGHMYVCTSPFPPAFEIEVGGNGYGLKLLVQRQPINSIAEVKISTIGDSPLKVSYTLDPYAQRMQFTISINNSSSAYEMLAAREIFNAYINGKGTLCGAPIESRDDNKNKLIPEESILFWHRVVEVEKALKVQFDVSQEIAIDDVKTVDILHRSFAENRPYKEYLKDTTLRGVGDMKSNILCEDGKPKDNEILFEYVEGVEVHLFGVTLQLYALVDVFGGRVSEMSSAPAGATGDFFVKVVPVEGKRMYSSTQFFLDEKQTEEVRIDRKHVDAFRDANTMGSY